ncbi:MAG TPA: portal protein, partial [Candidatus Poseidoniales archaeon]|nr:portal protein [Candidatus Poseidoniales archaeon]
DSTVIYNVARAPQKRVFYVDVGNLPKAKAEQYLNGIISKFKNKTVYDSTTGAIKDGRHIQSMIEDIWLPRKEGSKSTEISTLDGGGSL